MPTTPNDPTGPRRRPGRPSTGATLAAASLDDPTRTLAWSAGEWVGHPDLVAFAATVVADEDALLPVTPTGPWVRPVDAATAVVTDASVLAAAAVLEHVLFGRGLFTGDTHLLEVALDRYEGVLDFPDTDGTDEPAEGGPATGARPLVIY